MYHVMDMQDETAVTSISQGGVSGHVQYVIEGIQKLSYGVHQLGADLGEALAGSDYSMSNRLNIHFSFAFDLGYQSSFHSPRRVKYSTCLWHGPTFLSRSSECAACHPFSALPTNFRPAPHRACPPFNPSVHPS